MEFSKAITSSAPAAEAATAVAAAPARRGAQPLWPSCERQLELASARTCYVEAGRGFPMILVHGLLGYSFSWRKNIAALAKQHRVLALDLAGCGHSGPLKTGEYGVDTWSRQLEEFLNAMEISKAHLVATSAGGAVALDFAARCGERVERMALAAPVTPFSRRAVFLARLYTATGMPGPVMRALFESFPRLLPWLFRHRYYSDPARITPETVPGYLEGLRAEIGIPMLRQAISGWEPARLAPQLGSVKAPVLLLWGESDKIIPPSCISGLSKSLPNATVMMIPGAGHFCYEEMPGAFNDALLRFLRGPSELR